MQLKNIFSYYLFRTFHGESTLNIKHQIHDLIYYTHLTEAQIEKFLCPRLHSVKWQDQSLNPPSTDPESIILLLNNFILLWLICLPPPELLIFFFFFW